jgi:RNA polymerase sigma-70 factor, ECF subfamily
VGPWPVLNSPHLTQQSEQITALLRLARQGDHDAKDRLFRLIYPELRRIAAGRIRRERRGHTFQTGDLIHEAYLRLFAHAGIEVKDRVHFYATAAMFMRRILVDYARKRATQPQRAAEMPAAVTDKPGFLPSDPTRLLAVHQALTRLESMDQRQGQIVEMRFFGGMSEQEIAETLGLTSRTVKRDWAMARAWLLGELAS